MAMRTLVVVACTIAAPAAAQSAPQPVSPPDSLAERLRRAEEAIALLQQQLAEQAASSVSTRSRLRLELTGRVLMHSFRNERRVNNVDNPQFVRPDTEPGTAASVGMSVRQTTLGLVIMADSVLGGRFTGDLDVDFHGGQQPSAGGRTFPLLRVRTARGTVQWPLGELMVGQESPLIAGLSPVSPAAIGTPPFVTAGNLWLWLPQVRGTVERGGTIRLALQLAVLAPTTGDPVGLFDTDADPAERSGRPALQGRVRGRWGDGEAAGEVGCGVHRGWIASAGGALDHSAAAACDARIPLASRIELRGEAYAGRGLRGLGGGGISQNRGRDGGPLADQGGWAQVSVVPRPRNSVGVGCGVDRPREADVPVAGRLRNTACAVYGIARPGPLFVGLEARRLSTRYAAGTRTNHHLNLATGFEF